MIEDPVPPSHTRPAASTARAFSPDGYYRRFILASLALATLLGFALGLHVAATRLLDVGDPARTSDLIQAHGQIQLLGFAGLFVMGMGLRLMPTFAGARIAFGSFQGWIIALIAGSLVLRAVAMPLFDGDVHDAIFAASAYGLLLGAALFFFVTTATLTANARRFDSSSVAFIAGSGLLFLALLAAAFATIDAVGSGLKILPYLADTAVVHLEQTGFVLSFIVAVALRSLPTMVGLPRAARSAGVLFAGIVVSTSALSGSLLCLQYASNEEALVLIVDAALFITGLLLLTLVWQVGVLRQVANRLRPFSQPHLWLLRSAFVWVLVAALACLRAGASSFGASSLPSPADFDLVRHALGLGVITMLIVGMALMILPEFAAERQQRNRQAVLAAVLFVLLNLAAVLRVAPDIEPASWSAHNRNLAHVSAGALAETAMLAFAVYLARLMWRARAHEPTPAMTE